MIKKDKNEKTMKKKAECLDDTSPEDMEEGVSDTKMTRVKIIMRKNNLDSYMTPPLKRWRKV